FLAVVATATAAAPAAALAATVVAVAAFGVIVAGLDILVARVFVFLFGQDFVVVLGNRLELRRRGRARAGRGDAHLGTLVLALGQDFDGHAVAILDLGEVGALGVEHVDRRFGRSVERDDRALALGGFILDQPESRETGARGGADEARAIAVRARARRRLEHAGAEPLAAHLHQPEARDAADLDTGAVVLERVLHRLLDLTDVRSVLHVDEVDDDQAGHVAQAQLAGDLARGLEVGVERGLLDAVLLGRTARVDVDRNQRLGRIDDQVAAALQLHDRVV